MNLLQLSIGKLDHMLIQHSVVETDNLYTGNGVRMRTSSTQTLVSFPYFYIAVTYGLT